MIRPTLLMDAHVGFVRMNSGVEQSDIGENKGWISSASPARTARMPMRAALRFSIWTRMRISARPTRSCRIPQRRSVSGRGERQLDQGAGTTSGSGPTSTTRRSTTPSPEIRWRQLWPRGGFRYQSGPTQIQGPGGNLYNAFASFLLGVPNRIGRLKLDRAAFPRNWQYSLYIRDQWQASSRMTVSYGTRWSTFRCRRAPPAASSAIT